MARVFFTAGDPTPEPGVEASPDEYSNDESEAETDIEPARSPQKARHPSARPDLEMSRLNPPKRPGSVVVKPRFKTRDSTGRLPLQKACEKGDVLQVRTIIQTHPNLEDRDYAGTTALHGAALNGHTECVKILLAAGAVADVRSAPNELDTPLIDAVANGHLDCVQLLLSYGADPRVPNACGRCALDFVRDGLENSPIRSALRARIFELRSRGAPIVLRPDQPDAPAGLFPHDFTTIVRPAIPSLMELSRKRTRNTIVEQAGSGHMAYVGVAIERGWQPTPDALVLASRHGHADVVGLLLAFGLSPDSEHEGTTALKEAVKRCHLSVAKLLVDGGATRVSRVRKYVSDLPPTDPMRMFVESIVDRSKKERESSERAEGNQGRARMRKEGDDQERGDRNDTRLKALEVGDQRETENKEEPKAQEPEDRQENYTRKRPPEISKSILRSIKPKKRTKSVPLLAGPVEADATLDLGPQKSLRLDTSDHHVEPSDTLLSDSPIKPPSEEPNLKPIELSSIPASEEPDLKPAESTPIQTDKVIDAPSEELAPVLIDLKDTKAAESAAEAAAEPVAEPPNLTVEHMVEEFVAPAVATPSSPSSLLSKADSPNGNSSPLDGQWTERSQELSRLVQLKQAQRRDREAKMLQVLAQARRPNLDDSAEESARAAECAVKSPTPTLDSPDSPSEAAVPSLPVSVGHLPWALRKLAHTGKPANVMPLFSHEINGEAHLIDAQVALALGNAKLHRTHPQLTKAIVVPALKQQLWPFCRPWLCRPGEFGPSLAEDRRRFEELPLCWLRADEVLAQLFLDRVPSVVPIALLPSHPAHHRTPSLASMGRSPSAAAGSEHENVSLRLRRIFLR